MTLGGLFPGATTFPGATVYPGKGGTVAAYSVAPTTLIGTPA